MQRGTKLVGTDLSGLEGPLTQRHLDCHLVLLGADIPFIENLANLDLLKPRTFVCALPVSSRARRISAAGGCARVGRGRSAIWARRGLQHDSTQEWEKAPAGVRAPF
ncbi:MAG: hypothetical protein R3A46_21700 [Thermomicrobiales bacterium]